MDVFWIFDKIDENRYFSQALTGYDKWVHTNKTIDISHIYSLTEYDEWVHTSKKIRIEINAPSVLCMLNIATMLDRMETGYFLSWYLSVFELFCSKHSPVGIRRPEDVPGTSNVDARSRSICNLNGPLNLEVPGTAWGRLNWTS